MTAPPRLTDRIWTVPNVISFIRLLAIPYFLWLLLAQDDPRLASLVLLAIGMTDWVDGTLARLLDQQSELGRRLDPIADRVAIVAAVIGGLIAGVVPWLIAVLLLVREVLMTVVTAVVMARQRTTLQVRWLGKVATFAVYGAIPSFYMAAADVLPSLFRALGWSAGSIGLLLYWITAVQYVGDARRAMRAAPVPTE